jgi:sigma-B regulation protein RsbU (phosphoserine phosphatase)
MNVVPAFIGGAAYFPGFLAPFTLFWQTFSEHWMLISLILFSIYFPVRARFDRRFPWLKWLLILPQIPLIPATIVLEWGVLYRIHLIQPYLSLFDPLERSGNIFAIITLCVFIAAILRKFFTVPTLDARRRLGVVAAGSLLGRRCSFCS